MTDSQIIKLIILLIYLSLMMGIGVYSYKKNESYEDYIIGGRQLGKWTTAISAQASDMSGWLLLGLPGAAYIGGLESAWIALGLGLGTYLNWKIVAKRLRVYTEVAGNSLTLPEFYENRFGDKSKMLRVIPAVVIVVFFTAYTAAQFSAGAKLFEMMLGIPYQVALILGGVVIVGYTFLGGFFAVSFTDLIQGMLMFFALAIVPIFALAEIGGLNGAITQLSGIDPNFLSIINATGGGKIALIAIIGNIAWGLGYCGQPHILVRFMAIKDAEHIKASRRIACVWVAISLCASVAVGLFGRVYFSHLLPDSERVFMLLLDELFPAAAAGIFLSAVLASSMSTADSQLLVTATSVSDDIFSTFSKTKKTDKQLLGIGRNSVMAVSIIAFAIAWNPNSSVFELVSYAWAGLGAAFGPVTIMSLFWKRANAKGAMAGMVSGAATVLIWIACGTLFPDIDIFKIYELLPAFAVSLLVIYIVSKATEMPSQKVLDDFEQMKKQMKTGMMEK